MKKLLTASLILASSLTGPAFAQMDALQWTYRPLVVFAGPGGTGALDDLDIRLRQSRAALADRDMIVLTVTGDDVTVWNPVPDANVLPAFDADSLRRTLAPSGNDFEMLLVGKDGGVKSRAGSPAALGSMLDLIDTMPMRQRELEAREAEAERRERIENRMWGDESFGR